MRPPAHLHSPFSSPAIQMLPAGIADAAQRLMNGASATIDPALASTAAPEQAASQPQLPGSSHAADEPIDEITVPSRDETMEAGAPAAETVQQNGTDAAATGPADACAGAPQQPDACNGHSPLPATAEPGSPLAAACKRDTAVVASEETQLAPAAVAAAEGSAEIVACDKDGGVDVTVQAEGQALALRKLALLQQLNSSFSIPETPSLGDELRGGFKLPQHLDSLKVGDITCHFTSGFSCQCHA